MPKVPASVSSNGQNIAAPEEVGWKDPACRRCWYRGSSSPSRYARQADAVSESIPTARQPKSPPLTIPYGYGEPHRAQGPQMVWPSISSSLFQIERDCLLFLHQDVTACAIRPSQHTREMHPVHEPSFTKKTGGKKWLRSPRIQSCYPLKRKRIGRWQHPCEEIHNSLKLPQLVQARFRIR